MLLFGYIVSETKYRDLEEDIVKVVKTVEECSSPLPKLIVGLDKAKEYAKLIGVEFDILEHTYPNGDMWTFKKTEKREYYEDDLVEFKRRIVEAASNNVKYYYINVYKLKVSEIKRLYNILFNNKLKREKNYIIVDGEMFYFNLNNNKVGGISFTHLKYAGIDREKVIAKLKSQPVNKVIYTTSKKMWKLKEWFEGKEYTIPMILENNVFVQPN